MIGNKKVAGFSLVELMVSLTISVVFVGAAASLMARNNTDYVPLRDSSRMNEGAMAVFTLLDREIGQAGYFGDNTAMSTRDVTCSGGGNYTNHIYDITVASTYIYGLNRLREGTTPGALCGDPNYTSRPLSSAVEGFDGSAAAQGFLPSGVTVFDDQAALTNADDGILPGTDAITIRGSLSGFANILANSVLGGAVGQRGNATRLAQTIPVGANSIQVMNGGLLPERGYFIIFDGENTELFKGAVAGNTITLVADPRGNMPGTSLVNSYYSSVAGGGSSENGPAYVSPANFVRYYVSNFENADGDLIPSLYREYYDVTSDQVTREGQVLIEGVENMQITYAEDVDEDDNGTVDRYSRADQVVSWDNVKAVKIALLVRSESQSAVDTTTGSQTYQVNDQQVIPGTTDRYARRVFSTQITLDNGV